MTAPPGSLRWADMTVGDTVGPLPYVISPETAAEFVDAVGLDPAARALLVGDRGRPVAHPLLTQSDYMQLLQDRYGPMGTGLHIRQRTLLHRPIPVDVALTGRGQIIELYEKRGRDYWTMRYSVDDERGALVEHEMTASVDREGQAQPEPSAADAQPTKKPRRAEGFSPDVTFGTTIDRSFTFAMQVAFDRQYWLRYGESRRTGPNAHNDVEYAKAAGLPDAIAHSGHYYAWLAEAALLRLGSRWLYGGELSGRFLGPVFPGDELIVSAAFGEESRDVIRLQAAMRDGALVSSGEARQTG